ncbi:nucleotidyltransferase [Aureitalea sp. L0-47]|uniref:nucleotidyltransferase domain-containing protein n=1 Tax=Aureitalea sp. L0-47 TaxID=2816962 RepID=UPI0022377F8C|nr:nucleotidyltransferase [Aureitalea sp. L0-47]MCW5519403.1 nucleotidyltransferase [Aureitalea sp. L0-47]
MILFKNRSAQLDDLLARIAEQIQLDDTRKERMESAYRAIESLLNEDDKFFKDATFEIYPQGSVRIGTTVKPTGKNEFDLDIVVHIVIDWKNYTPQYIYNQLKRVLQNSDRYKDKVELKNRCVRLNYAGDFHMDILPGCQETSYDEDKLVVPDRELGDWTSSNPRGYGNWFIEKSNLAKTTLLEKAYAMEDLPADEFSKKKPLQRAVQLIKMYRDEYFKTNPKMATSSIILTTIAGEFYQGDDSIFDAIENIIIKIKQNFNAAGLVGNRLKILNPVNPQEDFSDKWDDVKEPELYEQFRKFILHLDEQWKILKDENGVIEEAKTIKGLFGEKAFLRAQDSQVDLLEKARKTRNIGINTTTGIIAGSTSATMKPIKENTFYGGE